MSANELFPAIGFITGVVGSIHCVAMCGGLVGILSAALQSSGRALAYWAGYHGGRILSYSLAGLLAAGTVAQISNFFPIERAQSAGAIIAGMFMIVLGGHIANWWSLLSVVEKTGGRLWNRLVPYFSKLLAPSVLRHAIVGGLLWGWIPCGLVYSTLAFAATSSNALLGAATMFAFGLGTLPMLLFMAAASHQSLRLSQFTWLRRIAGFSLCAAGGGILLGAVPLHIAH